MKLKSFVLAAAILLAFYIAGSTAEDPSILVKIHFKISWREMCQLEKYLKENIAKQIVVGKVDGAILDTDKIILYNFAENCRQPQGNFKDAVVSMYVSKISGNSNNANIDVAMTKKLYNVLHYLVEHKQERYLGNLFVGKIESVDVTGKDAPAKSTAYTEIEHLYIGLGVALAIIIIIITITVAVACYRKRNKPKNEDRHVHTTHAHYMKGDEPVARVYPEHKTSASDNPAYTADGQVSSHL